MKSVVLAGAFVLICGALTSTQAPAPDQETRNINSISTPTDAFLFSAADVAATRAKLPDIPYANITVIQRTDPTTANGVAYRMAVDRRRPGQRAAAHPNEGELWAIVDGAGEITTGGTIVETKTGDSVTRTIQGGTVHRVSKGDFLVVPENVPHHVTGFNPELVIVTFEYPRGVKK